MTSRLQEVLLSGSFAITAEVTPPVSAIPSDLMALVEPLAGKVDAINFTDGARARPHMAGLAAAALALKAEIEPVLQLTCRDRNRIALQSDLLGAAALGVRNILVLTGDDPKMGDQPDAKPVFDLDSSTLLATARCLTEGVMPSGKKLNHPPSFFLGAADVPQDPPLDWKPIALRRKVEAGAAFVQTQFCYDTYTIRKWTERLEEDGLIDQVFILIGIGPLSSAKSARWMRDTLHGVRIPDTIIDRLDGATNQAMEGRNIVAEIIHELSTVSGVDGVHLMAPHNPLAIPDLISASHVRR